ncbi:MAG: GTP-binding protein [Rhodospirillaceae bacterium]|nr:GTP-binding protein [Rhodospirillaceae bacterium]
MRLKSYIAPSMSEAMQLVRQELGETAIIVSTQRAPGGSGIRITAAQEGPDADADVGDMLAKIGRSSAAETVRSALTGHGVPTRLAERLVNAIHVHGIEDPVAACAEALTAGFTFAPLPEYEAPRPFMLVGPPGSGKSVAAAKLATRAVLGGRSVGVVTCDTIKAGAISQLAAITNILGIDLLSARGPEPLALAAGQAREGNDIVFIDSPGLNPFSSSDMDYLSALIRAADVEPILVLAAGGDAVETAEMAEAFAAIGATRMVATRLDITRRLGCILAGADAGPLMLAGMSATPHVVNGITPISADIMARMILPQPNKPSPSGDPIAEARL